MGRGSPRSLPGPSHLSISGFALGSGFAPNSMVPHEYNVVLRTTTDEFNVSGRVAPNPVKIKSYETTVFLKLEPEPKVL